MTRVLVVEPAGNLRGSERALIGMLEAARGLEVAVCCPDRQPMNAELAKRGIRVLPYYVYGLHQKSKLQRARAALYVFWACLRFRPDVIHLNQSGAYKVVLPAADLLGIPIVGHIRLFEDIGYLARQRPGSHRLRGLIAVSPAVLDEIRRHHELDSIPVHQIYDTFVQSHELRSNELASKRVAGRLGCVGHLERNKGQDILLAALEKLRASRKDVTCLFAGRGDDKYVAELHQMATDHGVAESVRWLGFVSDVVALLQSCVVLACPSHRETLGRVILEAWEAGSVPVVFSGSGGAAAMVQAAQGGILYDRQEPDALADALAKALGLSPESTAELIENGRLWVAQHCDPKSTGEAFTTVLVQAVNSRP